MPNMNNGSVLFNIAGGAILLTVAAYMGYTHFHTDEVSRCALRYPAGKQFAFDDRSGQPLTPMELQGRVGSREWGILKNARIVNAAEKANGPIMQVDLVSVGDDDNPDRTGVGFTWQSPGLAKAGAACLSYSVRLPPTFAFAAAGYLPGLFGVTDVADLDAGTQSNGFAARVGWHQGGTPGVEVRSADAGNFWQGAVEMESWPRGRWVPVEQEIILNSASAKNGTLRLWVDGKLQVENLAARFQTEPRPGLSGVVSDIGYAGRPGDPAELKISPFVIQWQ